MRYLNTTWLTDYLLVASTQPVPQPKSTPLLEALKAEKSANKDKETILRNHAHYSQIIAPASRKEEKKKTPPAPQPQASKASEATPTNVTNNVAGAGGKKSSKKGQPHVQAPSSVVLAPKAAPSTSESGPAPKNPTDGPGADPTKSIKAPRPPRAAPQSKGQSNNPSQNATAGDAPAAPSEAPARRSRPVIGLASRQFEAALSGVAGRERRAKGERGKEKESSIAAGNDSGPSTEAAPVSSAAVLPSHGASATGSDKVEPPPSPKKERTRRGGRGRSGSGGVTSGGAPPPVKISGILQRTDTAPSAITEQSVSEGTIDMGVNSTPIVGSGNRGGGRRGRGGHMKEKGVRSGG